ncbi:unnamed protein product [Aphanomyces euteiches]
MSSLLVPRQQAAASASFGLHKQLEDSLVYSQSSYASTSELSQSRDSYLSLSHASFSYLIEAPEVKLPRMQGVLRVPAKKSRWFSWRKKVPLVECWVRFNGRELVWHKSSGNGTYKPTPLGSVELVSSVRFLFQDLSPETFAIVDCASDDAKTRFLFIADNEKQKNAWLEVLCQAISIQDWFSGFQLGQLLGSGASSQVHALKDVSTNSTYAIKSIETEGHPENAELAANEIEILRLLPSSAHLTKLYKVVEDHRGRIGLVMPYHRGGNLADRIQRLGLISIDTAVSRLAAGKQLAKALVSALGALHGSDIVHLDVKPANILFHAREDGMDRMILADFGFAHRLSKSTDREDDDVSTRGTVGYMAPELIQYQFGQASQEAPAPLTPAADVFSAGVVLYQLLLGCAPFQGPTSDKIVERMMQGQMVRPMAQWNLVDPHAQDFVLSMLARDPKTRATIAELEAHPWLVS